MLVAFCSPFRLRGGAPPSSSPVAGRACRRPGVDAIGSPVEIDTAVLGEEGLSAPRCAPRDQGDDEPQVAVARKLLPERRGWCMTTFRGFDGGAPWPPAPPSAHSPTATGSRQRRAPSFFFCAWHSYSNFKEVNYWFSEVPWTLKM